LQHPIVRAPITVAKVVKPASFVWSDAAVGAGVASLALAVVAALMLAITRRVRKPTTPEGTALARTPT